MERSTLAMLRARWPQESMGICQADPQVRDYANDAIERLMLDVLAPDEGWANTWVSLTLTASISNGSAYVTVPQEIIRLIVTAVCKTAIPIRNGFFEYLHWGTGLRPRTCSDAKCGDVLQAYERDNVFTLADLVGTKTIRVYPTDSRDVGLRVLVQGLDQNGMTILTTDPGTGLSSPGEYIVIASPFVDSVNQFSRITGVMKDQTFGPITFTQVDPTTAAEASLSSMEPNESTGWYRRYLVAGIPCQNICCGVSSTTLQLNAQGRLGFQAVQNETDYLSLNNIPAIIEECRSLRFSRMDSPVAAQQSLVHHGRAIAYLNGELDARYGKTQTTVNVPIWGSPSNRLIRQPV